VPAKAATKAAGEPADKVLHSALETAALLGVEPYVLRYWTSSFAAVKPTTNKARHRIYRAADVATLQQIKKFLWVDRMTLAGVRRRLSELELQARSKPDGKAAVRPERTALVEIKREIEELRRILA